MKKLLSLSLLMLGLVSCHKKSSDPEPSITPAKAALTAPAANSTCITGTILSSTQSSVPFTWSSAVNAESYDLNIKNLLTGVAITQNFTINQATVTLARNTPYSWYIVSKSSKTTETSTSDVFKFYNAGVSTVYYAPFPADLLIPGAGQSVNAVAGNVTLSWNGSSVDNNIIGYDVYVGTTISGLALVKSGVVPTTYNVSATSGTIYYWQIITKDSNGNTSKSEVHQFAVN